MTFTLAACPDLNQFTGSNAGRVDQNAVKLLNLYEVAVEVLWEVGNNRKH
jgi:hypothetical protein